MSPALYACWAAVNAAASGSVSEGGRRRAIKTGASHKTGSRSRKMMQTRNFGVHMHHIAARRPPVVQVGSRGQTCEREERLQGAAEAAPERPSAPARDRHPRPAG